MSVARSNANVISATGYVTITNNSANVPVYFKRDRTTEGTETFTFKVLRSNQYALYSNVESTVTIYDNSIAPTFLVTTTATGSQANEGEAYYVNIYTTDIDDGTRLNWTLDGIDEYDILTPYSGFVLMDNNYANVRVATTEDKNTEGTETISFILLANNTPEVKLGSNVYANITLLDTSIDVTFNVFANVAVVGEGNVVEFRIETTGLKTGEILNYAVSGITQADLATGSVLGKIKHNSYNNGLSGNANVVYRIAKDKSTEGTETMTFIVLADSKYSLTQNVTANVLVTDNSRAPVYALTSNVLSVEENSTVQFNLLVENVDNNTSYSYVIEGVNSSDIVGGVTSGDLTIISTDGGLTGSANLNVRLTPDRITEGTESLIFKVLSNPLLLLNTNLSAAVTVIDTSKYPTISATANRTSVTEGGAVLFNITTTDVPAGSQLIYYIDNILDVNTHISTSSYTAREGTFTVNSLGLANIVILMKEDFTTEGTETLTLTIPANVTLNTDGLTSVVTIQDSSLTPELTLTTSVNPVSEGSQVTITFTGSRIPPGQTISWSITQNAADVTPTSGTVTMSANPSWPTTTGSVTLTAVADNTTEGGQDFILTTGAVSAINLSAQTITVNIDDTSQTPLAPEDPIPPTPIVVGCSDSDILQTIGSRGPGWYIFDIDCGNFTGLLTLNLNFLSGYDLAELEWNGVTATTGFARGAQSISINKSSSVPNSVRLQVNRLTATGWNAVTHAGAINATNQWKGTGWGITSISCPAVAPYVPPVYSYGDDLGDGTVFCPVSFNGIALQPVTVENDRMTLTGSLNGAPVWGNNSFGFTADSDLRRAAVHAGLLLPGQTGVISITSTGYKSNFPGSTSNGVTSSGHPGWCAVQLNLISAEPFYSVSPSTTTISENTILTFNVTTAGVASGTTLYYTITGIQKTDYSAGQNTPLTVDYSSYGDIQSRASLIAAQINYFYLKFMGRFPNQSELNLYTEQVYVGDKTLGEQETVIANLPEAQNVYVPPTRVDGLYRKGYNGYMNDVPSYFDNRSSVHEAVQSGALSMGEFAGGNNFSYQWLGFFKPTVSGVHTFFTTSDDCSFVWIGSNAESGYTVGNSLVNNNGTHPPRTITGSINLTAGTYYPIRIQFGENSGGEAFSFGFTPPGGSSITDLTGYTSHFSQTKSFELPAQRSGSLTITNGAGSISGIVIADELSEGVELLSLQLRTGSTTGPVVFNAPTVTITDSSTTRTGRYTINSYNDLNYSTGDTAFIEGERIYWKIEANSVPNGTVLYYSISGVTELDLAEPLRTSSGTLLGDNYPITTTWATNPSLTAAQRTLATYYAGVVNNWYLKYFGRFADQGGLDYWVGFLIPVPGYSHQSVTAIENTIKTSGEAAGIGVTPLESGYTVVYNGRADFSTYIIIDEVFDSDNILMTLRESSSSTSPVVAVSRSVVLGELARGPGSPIVTLQSVALNNDVPFTITGGKPYDGVNVYTNASLTTAIPFTGTKNISHPFYLDENGAITGLGQALNYQTIPITAAKDFWFKFNAISTPFKVTYTPLASGSGSGNFGGTGNEEFQ